MLICPVTKKCEFIVPVTKNSHLLTAILRPFGPGRKNFNTWDWDLTSASTRACKILSGSVKVCRSYSSDYSKQVYWICLYSWFIRRQKILTIVDFEQSLLSKVWDFVGLRCHAYVFAQSQQYLIFLSAYEPTVQTDSIYLIGIIWRITPANLNRSG